MIFKARLSWVKEAVDPELVGFFEKQRLETKIFDSAALDLINEMADFTLRGGKRTRAFLIWLEYELVTRGKQHAISKKQEISDELLKLMLGIELFQSFALIHDDILDKDSVRRGGPTVHESFKMKVKSERPKLADLNHFGESMAILAGDLAFNWAVELIRETENTAVQKLFYQMASETILGQILDVLRGQAGKSIDQSKIDKLKTAYYTVIRPLELGATLAGADQKALGQLKKYGLAVGLAYQLRDNLLDQEISDDIFETEKKEYLQKIDPLVSQIKTTPAIAALLREFALFVVTRTI